MSHTPPVNAAKDASRKASPHREVGGKLSRLTIVAARAKGFLEGFKRLGRALGPLKKFTGALARLLGKALGWARGHKLIAGGALGAILVIGNLTAWFLLAGKSSTPAPKETIDDALQALDRQNFPQSRRIAESLAAVDPPDNATWGGVPFVLATADLYERVAQQAEGTPQQDAQCAALLATARERGFPPGREAQGLYLLGNCLAHVGQYAQARTVLEESLTAGAPKKAVRLLLATAWSVEPRSDYAKARAYLDQHLADESLTATERQWTLVEFAREQLMQGDLDRCRKTLAEAPMDDTAGIAVQMLLGLAALVEARTEFGDGNDLSPEDTALRKALYAEAETKLQEAATARGASRNWARTSAYLLGACLSEQGERTRAIEQFGRVRRQHPQSYEAILAALDEADLLSGDGRDEEALALQAAAYRDLPPEAEIGHAYLPRFAPRERARRTIDELMRQRRYSSAIRLVDASTSALGDALACELRSAAHESWGRGLLADAEHSIAKEAEAQRAEGRRHLRQAGRQGEQLAKLHFADRRYPDDLWRSAEDYAAGRDFTSAVRQYRAYVEFETPRRRAEAMFRLADALLATGQLQEALDVVTRAVRDYPRHPSVYAGRVLASRIYVELGDGKQAEEMLLANLEGGQLAPESPEWRDSLFELGRLLYGEGRVSEALARLNEAVRRWPELPQTLDARYLIAESSRQRAEQLRAAAAATSVPSERSARQREIDQLRGDALASYEQVLAALEQRSDREVLAPLDLATLRNCYFGRGAMLELLGRFEEAAQAYADATNRYPFAPEVLDAYVQLAECYRQLGRRGEARGTIEQARVALARMAPETRFEDSTNYSRDEWKRTLDWLSQNL